MRWHHCLCHLSFKNLKILAENGEIPKQLAKVKPSKCTGSMFGAMTKQQTRETGYFCHDHTRQMRLNRSDASLQSNDTIFVDHFSGLNFIHPIISRKNDISKALLKSMALRSSTFNATMDDSLTRDSSVHVRQRDNKLLTVVLMLIFKMTSPRRSSGTSWKQAEKCCSMTRWGGQMLSI